MTELQKINACAKRPIDIWTNYIFYPLSIRLVYLLRNTRVSPNGLTVFSLIMALIGCSFFLTGTRNLEWIGLLLVQLSYVVDCADGQMARYRQQFSPIGGWLDQVADRIKEFAIYASLATGYAKIHPSQTDIWVWCLFALFGLYLLEYLGQVDFLRKLTSVSTAATSGGNSEPLDSDAFAKAQRLRSFIPFRSFIIGEQYFAFLVFGIFDAIHTFFIFVTVLGLAMVVYRLLMSLYKYQRWTRQQAKQGGFV